MEELTRLLIEFQKIPKRKRNRTFMEISGYPHYENVSSNILKFFFESQNEHNLNDLFVKSLLQTSGFEIDPEYTFGNVIVEREITTSENNRLDLLIETDEFIIGIENKIFHSLHNDLNDYSKTIENKAEILKKKNLKIVLSLEVVQDTKIKNNNFINITYPNFFKNIQSNLGDYILTSNSDYLIFLKGFITTINNLIDNNMENKELNLFFEKNSKPILDLISEFNKYQSEIFSKVEQLKDIIDEKKYTSRAMKTWVWEKRCLVHDYKISDKYKISVDTFSNLDGWEIQLFGRSNESTHHLLYSEMREELKLLNIPSKDNRLIIAKFKSSEIDLVAIALIDLLNRIESYQEKLHKMQK